jgi:hypothetical protein
MASLLERSFACSILWAPNITATATTDSRDHDRRRHTASQAETSVVSLTTAAARSVRPSSHQCSQLCQTEKSSPRANVVRVAPKADICRLRYPASLLGRPASARTPPRLGDPQPARPRSSCARPSARARAARLRTWRGSAGPSSPMVKPCASMIASVERSRQEASSSSAQRRVAGRARACARRGLGRLRKTSSGAYPRAMRESSQSRDARVEPEGRRWGRLVVIERAGSDQSHQSDQPSGAWRALRLRRNHRGRRRDRSCEV